MKRILFLAVAAGFLTGCDYRPRVEQSYATDISHTSCINGHLYWASRVYGGTTYTPLFDARTEEPRLIQCPNTDMDALIITKEEK